MDTKQNPAVEKVYRKLFALRATLPTDERDIFDQLIPAEEEVPSHKLANRKVATRKAATRAPEVAGHKLSNRKAAARKASSRKASAK